MKPRIWFGLDPSIAAFGYAVVYRADADGSPVCCALGTWKTKIDGDAGKLSDRARRVKELGALLLRLIDEWKPTEVYVESLALGMKTSRGTAQTLGRIRGLVEGICIARPMLELAEVRPEVVKQAVTGRKDATKEQVARAVARFYATPSVFDADTNATDALAVAHVGAHRFGHGANVVSGVVDFRDRDSGDDLDF